MQYNNLELKSLPSDSLCSSFFSTIFLKKAFHYKQTSRTHKIPIHSTTYFYCYSSNVTLFNNFIIYIHSFSVVQPTWTCVCVCVCRRLKIQFLFYFLLFNEFSIPRYRLLFVSFQSACWILISLKIKNSVENGYYSKFVRTQTHP